MVKNRRLHPAVALLVATAMSGCWGGAPTTPVQTPPAPVVANGDGAAPVVPDDGVTTLQGQVALRGMPWANATLQVVDAMTGKAADGTNLKVEGELKTDAEGRFNLRVSGLGVGKVARVIATLGNSTLTALASNEGPLAGAYHVQGAFPFKVNEITLCLDQVASGVLKMAGGLKSDVAADLIKGMLADLTAMAPKLEETFAKDDMLAINMALSADPKTGIVSSDTTVTNIIERAGLGDSLTKTVKTATSQVAQLAANSLNVVSQSAIDNVNLIGTKLTIKIENGALKVTDPSTGETITVNLPSSTSSSSGSTGGSTGGSSGGSSGPTVAFNPVATFDAEGDTIRLKVTQAANESDIDSLVVKVPVVAALGAVQVAGLVQNNPGERIASTGGSIAIGAVATLSIDVQDGSNGSLSFTGISTAPFGTTLNLTAGIEEEGNLIVPSLSNAILGNVRVFTGDNAKRWWAADNIYVAAKYIDQPAFNNATSLKTLHGHQSVLSFQLKNNVTFTNPSTLVVKVYVTPRSGSAAAKAVTAIYDANLITLP